MAPSLGTARLDVAGVVLVSSFCPISALSKNSSRFLKTNIVYVHTLHLRFRNNIFKASKLQSATCPILKPQWYLTIHHQLWPIAHCLLSLKQFLALASG